MWNHISDLTKPIYRLSQLRLLAKISVECIPEAGHPETVPRSRLQNTSPPQSACLKSLGWKCSGFPPDYLVIPVTVLPELCTSNWNITHGDTLKTLLAPKSRCDGGLMRAKRRDVRMMM